MFFEKLNFFEKKANFVTFCHSSAMRVLSRLSNAKHVMVTCNKDTHPPLINRKQAVIKITTCA